MLEDSQFHCLADAYLEALSDEIEARDEAHALDADIEQGALVISLTSGKQFLISKHAPSHQIWLSSPISGGSHFRYDEDESAWVLDGGEKLSHRLANELARETGLNFRFAV